MKVAFILLICLSFFSCSKNQKTEILDQKNKTQNAIAIDVFSEVAETNNNTTEKDFESESFEKYRLTVSIEGETRSSTLFIEFLNENTYCFCSPFGGYLWPKLEYTLNGNTLSLSKFSYENPFNIDELNEIFSVDTQNQFVDFIYDENFCTFDYKGGYRNGKIMLTDGQTKTPDGTVCYIGDTKVVKKSGYLVPVDNLKIRKEPTIHAQTGTINYNYELLWKREEKYQNSNSFNEQYVIANEDFYDKKNTLPFLLAGLIKKFDAVTVEKDTIDGITAPWYRISIEDEATSLSYWIFGGYIKEIDNPQTKDYQQLLLDSAVQNGLLISKASIEEEKTQLLNQAQTIYDIGKVLYQKGTEIVKHADSTEEKPHYSTTYYFNGNRSYGTVVEFVNNDLIQDTPLHIGMSKQDVINLWGNPHEETYLGFEYNTHELALGFGYEISLILENDLVTKIVCTFDK